MKIQQVIDYNADELRKYHDRTAEWNPNKGGFPQIAFYGFYTRRGNWRMTGYVASDENSAYWAKTKREAIEKYKLSS